MKDQTILLGSVRREFGIELGEGHERGFLFPRPIANLENYFQEYKDVVDEEGMKEKILKMVRPWEGLMNGLPKFLQILPEDYAVKTVHDTQEEDEEKKKQREGLICERSKELRRLIEEQGSLPELDLDLLERSTTFLASKRSPSIQDTSEELDRVFRRTFFIVCLITNAYIWTPGLPPARVLPSILSRPLFQLSRKLEQPPIVTHASLVLNNWSFSSSSDGNQDGTVLDLETLALFNTFTGSDDEFWFFGVAAIIEAQGARALKHICDIFDALNSHKDSAPSALSSPPLLEFIQVCLEKAKEAIGKMTITMGRMSQRCHPHIFYNHIRKFLPGWINNDQLGEGASCGMLFEDINPSDVEPGWRTGYDTLTLQQVEEYSSSIRDKLLSSSSSSSLLSSSLSEWEWESLLPSELETGHLPRKGVYLRLHGGSAGQSSLLHSLDISFGIHHKIDADVTTSTSTSSSSRSPPSFLHQMRYYMVRSHRAFLAELERQPSISQFIVSLLRSSPSSSSSSPSSSSSSSSSSSVTPETLRLAFNECVEGLVKFRNIHFQVVTRFIIGESAKMKRNNGEVSSSDASDGEGARGTGGSNLASFLKAVRDETKEAVIAK